MIKETKQGVSWYSWEILNRLGLRAGTSCRSKAGGEDFNLALHTPLPTAHDRNRVLENRKALTAALGMDPGSFTAARQTHSCHSTLLSPGDRGRGACSLEDSLPDTDALILRDPGLLGVIFTADCLPVILFDPDKRIAALIHAGWRGVAGGIVVSVLNRLEKELKCRREDIAAACGPAIGSCCYQVDKPVFQAVSGNWPETSGAFRPDGKDPLETQPGRSGPLSAAECRY